MTPGRALARLYWTLALVPGVLAGCGGPHVPTPPPAPPVAAVDTLPRTAVGSVVLRPVLGPPRLDPAGAVAWTPVPEPRALDGAASLAAADPRDSLGFWTAASTSPRLRPYALRWVASLALARGDTARADSTWAELAMLPGAWTWEALRLRTDLWVARGAVAGAESLLARVDRSGWSDLERAAWLARRMKLLADLGQETRAIELGRQLVLRYPALAPALSGLRLLDTLLRARGTALAGDDLERAAEVEFFAGERDAAIRRLRAVLAIAPAERRWRIGLRIAEVARAARRTDDALAAIAAAKRAAPDANARARLELERARALRDGRRPEAIAAFESAAREGSPALRSLASWERGLELESRARWSEARAAYAEAAAAHGARSADAALRVGFLWLAQGMRDSALAAWEELPGDAAEFWRAVVRRPVSRGAADSVLRTLAARPGYDFHRMAARETVGVRGWPGEVLRDTCAGEAVCRTLDLAADLLALGATTDAMLVLQRLSPAMAAGADSAAAATIPPHAHLRAARIAYAAGRVANGVRLSQRALDGTPASRSGAWGIAPWIYPPALDSLYSGIPLAPGDSVDRALLRAIAWQESKFDPDARSRSDAIGLYQMKLATAGDVARWLGESRPTEARLRDPATSLRYGTAYFRWLLARFDRNVIVALAAYNAGPGNIPAHWRELIARGGEALFCETISRPETRDYVRRILAARQAYREMRPHTGP